MATINGVTVPFVPIVQKDNSLPKFNVGDKGKSFDAFLNEELNNVKFSNHAMKRLEDRNISLNREDLELLNDAVQQAELKGSKDSLIMLNNNAFIVNIPNKTVVTALPVGEGEDVFTNIDSVVIK
ncbi:MAG: flagellar protein [Ignavibacteria bacterium]|nr:MAG: flagellar protein [Ignavibacteria bacterium]